MAKILHGLQPKPSARRRGSALIMAIIVSVIVTSLVMVLAWSSITLAQSSSGLAKSDQAYYVAEAGLQQAIWRYKHDQTWRADPNGSPATSLLTGSIVMGSTTCSYSVQCSGAAGANVTITSTGTCGTTQSQGSIICVPPPALNSIDIDTGGLGNFAMNDAVINGTMNINGSLSGDANSKINGNVTYSGTLDPSITVTGTKTNATPPALPEINYASLETNAGTTYGSAQSNKTFNFNTTPGTAGQKVIYVNGAVTNPTFIGSGTLVAQGNIDGLSGTIGSAANPVNLVCDGGLKWQGDTFTLYGAVYCTKWESKTSVYTINGPLVVYGPAKKDSGYLGTFNGGLRPWFDPRGTGAGGTGSVTYSNYGSVAP